MIWRDEVGDQSGVGRRQEASLWDPVVRFAYRSAFLLARIWWGARRPRSRGALIAVWSEDRVLLVRTCYRGLISLPDGFVRPSETARHAAARELSEEVGLAVDPSHLGQAWEGTIAFEGRLDATTIFELELPERPRVTIDYREIVWAAWVAKDEALALPLLPHLRAYLETIP